MRIRITAAILLGAGLVPGAPQDGGNSSPQFDVVSVKLDPAATGGAGDDFPQNGLWRWTRIPLSFLIERAYGVSITRVTNVPPPFQKRETAFTIIARTRPDVRDAEFRLMLQSLLKERFRFAMHWGTKEMPVLTIEVAKGGPLLKPASGECAPVDKSVTPPPGQARCGEFTMRLQIMEGVIRRHYAGRSVSMSDIVETLSSNEPAVDETGIQGKWDIDVETENALLPPTDDFEERENRSAESARKTRLAFEKQSGLMIDFTKSKKRPVPVIVVDHVELPTPD